jgi:hypothetical protein
MNEESQNQMFEFFNKNGIKNFVGVSDSTIKYFINKRLKTNKIISTRIVYTEVKIKNRFMESL